MTASNSPNFFIVGAARAGTTSLWQYLKVHPQVFMPQDELNKEPAYFSDKGAAIGLNNYLELFKDASEKHIKIGEASTAYLTDPSSAKRIFAFDQNAKIIIILRNPAERAYSLYRWMVQDGYEYADTFEVALQLEAKRSNKNIPTWLEPEYSWNYMYFKSGLYSEQVQRYIDLFDKNMLIIDFEDFKSNPAEEYMKVCQFLEIDEIEPPEGTHNASQKVLSPSLQFILRKITYNFISSQKLDVNYQISTKKYFLSFLRNSWNLYKKSGKKIRSSYLFLTTASLRKELRKNNFRFCPNEEKGQRDFLLKLGTEQGKPSPIKEETKNKLLNLYQEDIQKLEQNLHRSFSRWS